jgi:integrase
LVTGSNPVSGAILHKALNCGLSNKKITSEADYDTSRKIYDTKFLRLYRVNKTYYYRRRINSKLVRISLRTKNINEALKRKKVLDLLKGEELFELTTKDFKLVFEYDTEEELRIALENAMRMQVEQQVQHYKSVKTHIETQATNNIKPDKFTFEELKEKYLSQAVFDGNVKKSSISDYTTTFNRLINYFKDKDINELTVQDIEAFKLHLNTIVVRRKNLSKKTINKHLIYTKQFLKFAKDRDFIIKNIAEPVKLYNRRQVKQEEQKKENFTKEEIQKILNQEVDKYFDSTMKTFFEIAIYSGMRLSEINSLTKDSIKFQEEVGVHYFDIQNSKTHNGIREVPIHSEILDKVLKIDFPLYKNQSDDSLQKKMNRQLKKIFQDTTKTFHTFRGTFVDIAMNKNSKELALLQEVVGHSKNQKDSLTTDSYGHGFELKNKQRIVESVNYFD